MAKLIGVIGATGTGKTTLCENAGYPFIKTDVSGVYKEMGLDPKLPMDLLTRLKVQRAILRKHESMWRDQLLKYAKALTVVTDRTPICFMAYTLAEISGYRELTAEEEVAVTDYLQACDNALEDYFDGMFHLAGRPFAVNVADGKVRATQNFGYHSHYQALSIGLTTERVRLSRRHICYTTMLDDRVATLRNFAGSL